MSVPVIRFNSFSEDWHLESISSVISNKSKKYDPIKAIEDLPCIELEHLSQQTGEILDTISAKDQKSIKNIFDENSVLFGKLRPYLRKFARPDFKGVCSSEIWVLKSKKLQPDFLFQYIQTDNFFELTQIQAGSKMPRADWESISKGEIYFPNSKEQTKVASFLSNVDKKISQLTQKHELLSQYKQGMMQKLFSQQLRFKADDGSEFGEWEDKKLGDICSHFQSGKTITSATISDNGAYPVFGGNGLRGFTDTYTHDGIFALIGRQGALCGNINLVQGENFISEHAIAVQANQESSTQWLAMWLDFMQLNRFSESSAQAGLAVNKLVKFDIKVPCLEEQTKIANFLSAIDQKIEVVAQQIEQAKTWKKGLLQQMFV